EGVAAEMLDGLRIVALARAFLEGRVRGAQGRDALDPVGEPGAATVALEVLHLLRLVAAPEGELAVDVAFRVVLVPHQVLVGRRHAPDEREPEHAGETCNAQPDDEVPEP